jgi:hypothetical protein
MPQLELVFLSQPDVAPPRMIASAVLRRHRAKNDVLRMVAYVRRYFPELDNETVTVGLTRAASGMAVPGGKRIWLNPSRLSYHTISHGWYSCSAATWRFRRARRRATCFRLRGTGRSTTSVRAT